MASDRLRQQTAPDIFLRITLFTVLARMVRLLTSYLLMKVGFKECGKVKTISDPMSKSSWSGKQGCLRQAGHDSLNLANCLKQRDE